MVQRINRTEPRGWFDLFFAHHGWLAMIAAALLFVLTLVSAYQYRLASAFADHGEKIMAEVVDKDIRKGDDSVSYYLTFRYTPKGSAYGIKHKVGERYFDRHPLGSMAEIYYLPNQPHMIQTHPFEIYNDAVVYQIMAAISGIAACGVLMFSGNCANSAVKARRYGLREAATVTRIEVVQDSDGKPTNQRRLVWRDSTGRFGTSLKHDLIYLKNWSPGDDINVFRGPRQSWWEGDVGPREAVPRAFPNVHGAG